MGGSGPGPGPVNKGCEDLEPIVTLQNPNVQVLGGISEGTTLNLRLQVQGQSSAVVAYTDNNQIVGIVASGESKALKKCMERGHRYNCDVLEKDYAYCLVNIWYAGTL